MPERVEVPACPAGCDAHGEWCWPPLSGCCGRCPAEEADVIETEETAVPAWMTSARWPRAHLIVGASATWLGSVTESYRMTACGRRVRVERLDPEFTGIDTQDRCECCRGKAPSYGADDDV